MQQSNENIEILPMTFFVNPLQEVPSVSEYSVSSPKNSLECEPQLSNKFRFVDYQNKPRSISFEVKQNFQFERSSKIKNQKDKYHDLQQRLSAKDSQIEKLKQQVAFLRNQSTLKEKQNSVHKYRQRVPSKHPLEIGDFNNLNIN